MSGHEIEQSTLLNALIDFHDGLEESAAIALAHHWIIRPTAAHGSRT